MSTDHVSQYLQSRRERLTLLEAMWNDPKVQMYNDVELPPKDGSPSVFLNGPTSRHQILELNHRCLSVYHLRTAGFTGWIFAPEPRGQEESDDFTERDYIHKWESSRRFSASCNSFWIPRDGNELLGLNSNLELGIDLGKVLSGIEGQKVFVGWPDDAMRMGLPSHYRQLADLPLYRNLWVMCEQIALQMK
ncbi:MAG: hypothetical protein NUW00_03365 [Candidatus Kaiserbacteria bacterium]|nr:hypothetical protein [Candidatus Kaiserbacteria bacterium]